MPRELAALLEQDPEYGVMAAMVSDSVFSFCRVPELDFVSMNKFLVLSNKLDSYQFIHS